MEEQPKKPIEHDFPWWGKLTEKEKAKYRKFPAYIQLRNYVESDGDETQLHYCTFREIVRVWKGTFVPTPHSLWRTSVAYDDWKLSKIDAIVLGPLEDSRDTVQLAKHLIEWDVLDDNFPYNFSSEEEEEEEDQER